MIEKIESRDEEIWKKTIKITQEIKRELAQRKDVKKDEGENIKNIGQYIEKYIMSKDELDNLAGFDVRRMKDRIEESITKDISILHKYIENSQISEIMVNGYDEIFIEEEGRIKKVDDRFFDEEELGEVIRRIGNSVNREINERIPILDARLEDGSRVNAVYKNLTGGKNTLTIRKFVVKDIGLEELVENQTLSVEALEFLKTIVARGYNIFVSGGTSSGKTTMLNAILKEIPAKERVIIIEDSKELLRGNIENIVQMECKESVGFEENSVGIDRLIKTSLRMRPDRIVIGEIRDGKALINMLNGLNTGHSGLSTGHSNSVAGMIRRMESMYMQESTFPIESIDEQIAEAIDVIIHLKKNGDGKRKVVEISEIYLNPNGRISINHIFKFKGEKLVKTGNKIQNCK